MTTSVPGFVGERLRQARESLGISKISLAEMLGVTRQAVSNWETENDGPRQDLFERICEILRQPEYFFVRPVYPEFSRNTTFYRSLSSTTKTARARAETKKLWAREIVYELQRLVELPPVKFPQFDKLIPLSLSDAEVDRIAIRVRDALGVGSGPLPNLVRLFENHGGVVVRDSLDTETMDALSEWLQPEDRPIVVLNTDKKCAVRSRLDLAHELGHLALHRTITQDQLNNSKTFKFIERQAFRFGGALLLPEKPFLSDLYSLSLDTLRALKSKWRVSIAAMIVRLAELGLLTEEQQRRMWINYGRRGWREKEPLDDQLEIEMPSVLPKAFDVIVGEGWQVDQLPALMGHGKSQISSISGLSRDYFTPSAPQVNVIRFRKPCSR